MPHTDHGLTLLGLGGSQRRCALLKEAGGDLLFTHSTFVLGGGDLGKHILYLKKPQSQDISCCASEHSSETASPSLGKLR